MINDLDLVYNKISSEIFSSVKNIFESIKNDISKFDSVKIELDTAIKDLSDTLALSKQVKSDIEQQKKDIAKILYNSREELEKNSNRVISLTKEFETLEKQIKILNEDIVRLSENKIQIDTETKIKEKVISSLEVEQKSLSESVNANKDIISNFNLELTELQKVKNGLLKEIEELVSKREIELNKILPRLQDIESSEKRLLQKEKSLEIVENRLKRLYQEQGLNFKI